MKKLTKETKVGVSMSGGGTKSGIYLGVIKGLVDNGYNLHVVGGLSGGAIISALYGAGHSIEDITKIYQEVKLTAFLDTNPLDGYTILDHEKIYHILTKHLKNKTFEDCKTKTVIFATDIQKKKVKVFNTGPLVPAVIASASIPPFFKSYQYDGSEYIDGGFTVQYGAQYLKKAGAEFVIGADVNGFSNTKFPTAIDVMYKAVSCALSELFRYERLNDPVDLELSEFNDDTGMLDFKADLGKLISIGEESVTNVLKI